MALDLLDTPLRISWALHHQGVAQSPALVECLTQRVVEAGVFFVTLEGQPLLHPQIQALVAQLTAGGCQTLVVCDGGPADLEVLVPGLAIQWLLLDVSAWIDTTGLQRKGLSESLAGIRAGGYEATLQMVPTKENILLIPEVFALAGELGAGRIKLPNTPHDASLTAGGEVRLPGPADLKKLAELLASRPLENAPGLQVEIHDLFLWELLNPLVGGERGEYGGCQAANSLGHIDGEGWLHPCSSWLQPLGQLVERSIEELWATPLRYQVREEIGETPQGCLGCGDYPLCLGGCRGLGRSLNQGAGGRDLLCSGPRPPRP